MISYLMTMVIIINGLFQGAHKLEGSGLACGACGDGDARLRKVTLLLSQSGNLTT